jgi:DNA-binding CsgD family transcriptional regulator
MDILMFFYNITITLVFGFCCVNFLILYGQHRDKRLTCLSLVFFLFILDNLVLYMQEFLPEFTNYYNQTIHTEPYMSNFSTLAICFSYRLTMLAYDERSLSKRETALWIMTAAVIFAATAFYKYRVCSTFGIVIISAAAISPFAGGLYRIKKFGPYPKAEFSPNMTTWFLSLGLLLEIGAVSENVMHYLGYGLFSDRIISIELLSILFSVSAVVFLVRSITKQRLPAMPDKSDRELEWLSDIESFCTEYSLTLREREILNYIIQGYSIDRICTEACIAQGTVKSHTHNIYQKLNISNRIQLLSCMREFSEQKHMKV